MPPVTRSAVKALVPPVFEDMALNARPAPATPHPPGAQPSEVELVDIGTDLAGVPDSEYERFMGDLLGGGEPASIVQKFVNTRKLSIIIFRVRGDLGAIVRARLQLRQAGTFCLKWTEDAAAHGDLECNPSQ